MGSGAVSDVLDEHADEAERRGVASTPTILVGALVATGGSLYFSEVAHFIPCKLCWFQRVSMYPLVLLALPALRHDRRAAQYLLPLPIVGFGVAAWHMLVERGVIEDAKS